MDQHYLSFREDGTFKSALEIPLFLPRNRHECIDFSLRLKMGGLSLEVAGNHHGRLETCRHGSHSDPNISPPKKVRPQTEPELRIVTL